MDCTSETSQPAAILSLDQEKAFDRVDWDFLFKTLDHMGFSPSFVKWVPLVYNNIRSAVSVDGYRSSFFFPSCGVRQGCPLSPLLYVISIEILVTALWNCPDIPGLKAPGLVVRLPTVSLYADDTFVIVSSDAAIRAVFSRLFSLKTESMQVSWLMVGYLAREEAVSCCHPMVLG